MSSSDRPGQSATTMKPAEEADGQRPYQGALKGPLASPRASTTKSDDPDDPFPFSPLQSPECGKPSPFSWQASATASASSSASGHPACTFTQIPCPPSHKFPSSYSSSSSNKPATHTSTPQRPGFNIALPPSAFRQLSSRTTTEPPSARGDEPGGCFPLYENPEKRIHRPHHSHTATQEAQEGWDADALKSPDSTQAVESTSSPISRPVLPPLAMSAPRGQLPTVNTANMPRSQGLTRVTSYVPSGGFHETPMPVGKYYPSNYERRHNSTQNAPRTSRSSLQAPSGRGPASAQSDTAVPQLTRTDPHVRSESDATRRLQQYQRDMVAQAYLAAQRATQELASKGGASAALAAASRHGAPLSKFQFSTAPGRPISPRLEPLGSPGPVTPLALEGADGYLTARDRPRPVPSPDAGRESQAVARAMRAEQERNRREGQHSPAVEAGGFGF